MEMLDIVLSFVPHYTRWDVLRYIDFQEEKTMNRTHLSVRMLCEAAVMVALAQILSYLKLMELPNGGSLTPAMFPIILFAVRWGTAPGLMAGFVFGLLQLIFDGAYAWGWQSMLLDYVVAYTLVFLCGFAAGKKLGWLWGTILAGLGRWVSLTLSGGLLWYMYMPEEFLGLPMVDPWVYSMIFNGVLIVLVTVVNLIVLGIFQSVPALRQKLLTKQN